VTDTLDRRRHPYRDDLAAEHLRDRVSAQRYAQGTPGQIIHSATQLRDRPDLKAGWTTEALFGEIVTVYERKDSWAWIQLERDGYVGYVHESALTDQVQAPTHMVRALGTFLYPEPDIKSPPWVHLSITASLAIAEEGAPSHVSPMAVTCRPSHHRPHPLRRRLRLGRRALRRAYPTRGAARRGLGVDCSGLVQVAMQAAGHVCPRDSDMQQAEVGEAVPISEHLDILQRGDLVFWKGHVGIMTDGFMLLARQRPPHDGGPGAAQDRRRPHRPYRLPHHRHPPPLAQTGLKPRTALAQPSSSCRIALGELPPTALRVSPIAARS
jgi:hypothetical protein